MARKKKNTPSKPEPDYLMSPEELKSKLAREEAAIRKEKEAIIGPAVSEREAQAMSVASTNKILGTSEVEKAKYDALQALVSSGTVAKMLFDKPVKGVASKTAPGSTDSKKEEGKDVKESLSAIALNLKEVVKSFSKMTAALQQAIDKKDVEAYRLEEQQAEAVPVEKERPTQTGAEKGEKSFGDLFSDFFKNPAIIAAFSGLVYLFLPKDIKEKISSFFTGFSEGVKETSGELDTFKTALLAAAAGLATYLGVGVLKSVAEGITTTMSLITKAKTAFGKMGRAGKIIAGVAVAGGAAAAGVALAGTKEEEEALAKKEEGRAEGAPGATATEKPGPAGSAPAQKTDRKNSELPKSSASGKDAGMKESGGALGSGLRSQSRMGLQLPSGSDADTKKMIIHHEGIRHRPYKDSLGLWTVGVGHLIGDGKSLPPEYNREFTNEEVMEMFDRDFEHHKQAAEKIPGYDNLNDKGQAALVDLTFNMGPAWYKKWPNFTRNLKEGDTEGAAKSLEDSKWYTQVGRRAPTIVSLIRQGGEEDGSTSTTSIPSFTPTMTAPQTASLEVPQVSSGMKVAAATERNDAQMTGGQSSIINNAISNNKQLSSKKGPDAPPPIPSPVANRGTLDSGIRHSTSYT
jgi:lysozyme